jgi:hypothetical protein
MPQYSRLLLVAVVVALCSHPALATQPLAAAQQSHQPNADAQQLQQHGAQQPQAATQQHLGAVALGADSSLQPPIWPEQFKSVMFQNRTNKLALVTLYYDWKLGANLNIISSQLGAAGTVWDLEWNNGAHTTVEVQRQHT